MRREETLVKRPEKTLGPKKKEVWREGICCDVVREPGAMFVEYKTWLGRFENAYSMYRAKIPRFQSRAERILRSSGRAFVCVGLAFHCQRHVVRLLSENCDRCKTLV